MSGGSSISRVVQRTCRSFLTRPSRLPFSAIPPLLQSTAIRNPCRHPLFSLFQNPNFSSPTDSTTITLRLLNTSSNSKHHKEDEQDDALQYTSIDEETPEEIELWEEEDEEAEPEIGDGGDGGGVVLQGLPWGERALSLAHEVLSQFGDPMKLYAFKITPRGYVYVRLDNLSNDYGCPSMEELENYSQAYKKRLDEAGALGETPDDLALEVSSPSAERLLKVPDDLSRFKDMPMRVCYREDMESKFPEKNGVFLLESIELETQRCIWKLANVKENRDPESKGRPLSRKQKDWRLQLPYEMHIRVTLCLDY
ncbi:hypothetical protein HS088_TW07G01350 [Tripterygium wilfordii]|uniref:DUF7912 domain-containing protein n=2 Tax=Tripterygium wilfordii TaxID=458696 RepID=A0A7J7DHC2_TRIWF|nr:hypothetical protein HS088_TW07G01350 [Tripterygium wilfordii]